MATQLQTVTPSTSSNDGNDKTPNTTKSFPQMVTPIPTIGPFDSSHNDSSFAYAGLVLLRSEEDMNDQRVRKIR